jgi:hypothetical protein
MLSQLRIGRLDGINRSTAMQTLSDGEIKTLAYDESFPLDGNSHHQKLLFVKYHRTQMQH